MIMPRFSNGARFNEIVELLKGYLKLISRGSPSTILIDQRSALRTGTVTPWFHVFSHFLLQEKNQRKAGAMLKS